MAGKVPPFIDDLNWFPHFSHQQCLLTAGSPHKNLILTGHEGGPPSGFCLEPLHAKHPSRKQDNSLEKKRRWRSKSAAGTKPSSKLCAGHHVGCSKPFFPQGLILRWTGMNPSSFLNSERCRGCLMFFQVNFAPLRRVAGSECLASNPWTWPLDLPAIRRHHRPWLEHSRAGFRGHVSNTKSVPKNSQWMGWRQKFKGKRCFVYICFLMFLYQQWHGFSCRFFPSTNPMK